RVLRTLGPQDSTTTLPRASLRAPGQAVSWTRAAGELTCRVRFTRTTLAARFQAMNSSSAGTKLASRNAPFTASATAVIAAPAASQRGNAAVRSATAAVAAQKIASG